MDEAPKLKTPETALSFCSATHADIDGILAVQDSRHDVTNPEQAKGLAQEIENEGFMEELFTREELERIFEDPDGVEIMICKSEEKVLAYMIGYDMEKWLKLFPNWLETVKFKEGYNIQNFTENKTMYVRHLCSLPNQKMNPGLKVASAFFKKTTEDGYVNILSESLKSPLKNNVSKGIIEKKRGEEVAEVTERHDDEEYVWGLHLIRIQQI